MPIAGLHKQEAESRTLRYGAVALLGVWTVICFLSMAPGTTGEWLLAGVLLSAAIFDFRYRLIPNQIILFGVIAWIGLAWSSGLGWTESLAAAGSVAAVLLGIRRLGTLIYHKPPMGMGDIKLFLVTGLYLGWNVFWVLYLTVMLAGLFSSAGMIGGYIDRKQMLPLAPFIALAAASGLLLVPWDLVALWLS